MKRSDAFFASRTKRCTVALTALLAIFICAAGPWAATARAQGSRKDDIVLNSRGQPLAGAQVRVCASNATTTSPCTPLASVYSDPALTQALANPFTTDGMGNYNFYAAPGRYVIELSGAGITTRQIRDVIVPNDPSAPTFTSLTTTSGINAFTLSLSGNLTVAGSAAVTGALTVGGSPVPSVNQANTWTALQQFNGNTVFKGPSPWYDILAYGAPTDGVSDAGPAFSSAWLAANASGGTVYIPPLAAGFVINTCPAVPNATPTSQVTIRQAANLTFGSGCATWNMQNVPTGSGGGTSFLTWEGVGGGIPQNADFNGPTASISSSQNAPVLDFIVNGGVTLRHLDIRCNNASLSNACVIIDHGASGTGAGYWQEDVNVFSNAGSGSNPAELFNGNSTGGGGFQANIHGGAIAVTAAQGNAGVQSLQITYWGGVTIALTHHIGGIGIKYLHGNSAPVTDVKIADVEFEASKYPFVLDSDSSSAGGGSGISGVTIVNPLIADSPAGGAAIKTTGVNAIRMVTVMGDLTGSAASFSQGQPIGGLTMIGGSAALTDTNMTVANSNGCVFAGPGNSGCWGTSNDQPGLTVSPGILVAGVPAGVMTNGADAHHFYDSRNGGNGIAYSSMSGSGNGYIARFDGAGAFAGLTLESTDNTYGILQFLSPTHGGGSLYYQHATGQKSMVFQTDSGNHLVLYSSAQGNNAAGSATFFGDLHIEAGNSTNGINLTGAPTAFRSQTFQDASGTIALTSQLPLTGTTSSIGGSALAAGACTTGTASVTGTTTSMAVAVSPASDPGTGFTWTAWVSTAGTVTARVCNVSGASATPAAVAYNVRAIQ